MRSVCFCSLLFLLALTSCTRSPADQLKTELQTVTSWTATARMAGEAWLKGTVPHAYAARTLRTAEETLEDEARTIQEQAQDKGELQASLASRVRETGQVIDRMRAAIESRDAQTLDGLLKQLAAGEQTMKGLVSSGGVQP